METFVLMSTWLGASKIKKKQLPILQFHYEGEEDGMEIEEG